ncbi:MAG: tetratricopeptide repeat protein [Chthonomonadales bacterium]
MLRSILAKRAPMLLLILLALLLVNSAYLAVSDRLPNPPRSIVAAFTYEGNVLLHLVLGLAALGVALRWGLAWLRAIRASAGAAKIAGRVAAVSVAVCFATGAALVIWGNLRPMAPVLTAHAVGALAAALTGVSWLLAQRVPSGSAAQTPRAYKQAAVIVAAVLLPAFGLMWMASRQVDAEARILNPAFAPASMDQEGDGPRGKFWPASVQSVDNRFFPPQYFTDNESCGEKGCHPDIYEQWRSSVHHRGSFNNQWYRKAIEYMQEVVGPQSSKWCGGCHDMAILLTEMPGTGKSRMDFPIKDQIWPREKHPEAWAGIGCAACHSTVHVKSTMGNNDYVADYPPMHQFVLTRNPVLRWTYKFLTRIAPDPHRKTFLKPFHTMDTAKFCSACHKVHLDMPVNHYRWFRGFDEYDAWQASGVSGFGARSFYYPQTNGRPDFKKCADCHMPLVRSNDAGNIGGFVHSHRFPGANTAVPYVYHDQKQLEITQKFLRNGALSIDIFALRREGQPGGANVRAATPAPGRRLISDNAPRGASLFGEAATTGDTGPLMAAHTKVGPEVVIAPIDRGPVAVQRGTDVLLDVVVRTRKVGHAFPGGTFDAFDVWVELQAKDERGKILFWSGALQGQGGPVDPSAHMYQALLVDGHSNPINKRNAWQARARIYARAIPPGAADTVHYRLHIPKDCGNRITVTAKLNYRKFSWYNTQFAFGGRPQMPGNPGYSRHGFIEGVAVGLHATKGPVTASWDDRPMRFDGDLAVVAAKDQKIPDLPITVLAQDEVTLNVVDKDPARATAPRKLDLVRDRERWNDYGIGLMLQGDFFRATRAFQKVEAIAPDWPEGYVNFGRARLQEGSITEAVSALERALALYEAHPTPMTPYLKARTQFFYGLALKELGQYDRALQVWQQVRRIFPDDRELRNQMGRVYFLQARFDEAIAEFNHVLSIDPEDLTANYNLMLCYRGKGPAFAALYERYRTLYYRFKADETTTYLEGPYRRSHPDDNNEAIAVHEHTSGPIPAAARPYVGARQRGQGGIGRPS